MLLLGGIAASALTVFLLGPLPWGGIASIRAETDTDRGAVAEGRERPTRAAMDGARRTRSTRADPRFDEPRRRYAAAVGLELPEAVPDPKQPAGLERPVGGTVLRLDHDAAKALVDRGWRGPGRRPADIAWHGERIRVFAAVARAAGMPASVGALQASFGTPAENGLGKLTRRLEKARRRLEDGPGSAALAASVGETERALAAALAKLPRGPKDAKPEGEHPRDVSSWALADLDLNDDGRVNRRDLRVARNAAKAAASPSGNQASIGPAKRPRDGWDDGDRNKLGPQGE